MFHFLPGICVFGFGKSFRICFMSQICMALGVSWLMPPRSRDVHLSVRAIVELLINKTPLFE